MGRRCLISAAIPLFLCAACDNRQQVAEDQPRSKQYAASAIADSLLDVGEAAYRRSEYDSAAAILEAGRAKAVDDGDSTSVARADTWRGLAAMRLGRNEESRKLGEAALAMKQRLGLKRDLFRSFNALGLLAHQAGRYSDAIALFASARSSADAVQDSASIAKAIGNSGLVHSDVGEFDLARREFSYLAASARTTGDTMAFANSMSNLGMVEVRSGNATAALVWLGKARPLYAAIDYPTGEESVLGQLGGAFASLGEHQKAIAYMDSAMMVARKHGLVREEAEDLQVYAELIGEAGDHAAALRHLARARVLSDSAGLESRTGDIARAQARELAAISRSDLALSRAREAIAIHRRVGNEFEMLSDNVLAAELAQERGQSQQARQSLAEATRLAAKLSVPIAQEILALGIARVADIAGDPAAVLRALPANIGFGRLGPVAAGEGHGLRARSFGKLGQWPEAVVSGRMAVAALDAVRRSLGEGPLRSAFTSDNASIYGDLVVALLQLGRTDEAFEVADAARGRTLMEHLSSLRQSNRSSTRDLAEADRLLRRIEYLTERLRIADTLRSADRTVGLRKDQQQLVMNLTTARNEYEDRMQRAARTDPRGTSLLGMSRVKVSRIRGSLRTGEVLLEYLVTSERLFLFLVSRDTVVSVVRVINVDELANRVRLASQLMSSRRNHNPETAILRGLHDILVAPVSNLAQFRQASSIVVVPHSALAYLPFAALVGPDGKHLVASRSVLMLPSASALPLLRGAETRSMEASSAVFAPFPSELRGTMQEATAVKVEIGKAQSFIGARATERQLRAMLQRGGNVHVASHALLNPTNPMFSHIELALGKTPSPDDDGRLDVHELLQMAVRSDLVYLSGCETGAGAAWSTAFRRNQDYATLSQAILYAGAENVVATLWRIDDQGASVFARRFYSALARSSAVEALAIAQREMIRNPRYAAPRYWAGYTISGSGGLGRDSQSLRKASVQ